MNYNNDFQLTNEAEKSRFEIVVDDMTAFVDYIALGKKIIYTHTEVPQVLEGRGIGSALAHGVLDYARENHLEVVPLCPFIGSWLRSHPEYQDVLAKGVGL